MPTFIICLVLLILLPLHALAIEQQERRRLTLELERDLAFGLFAGDLQFAGAITIDAITGARTVTGAVDDLGGIYDRGRWRVRGSPHEPVYIELPHSIQATNGAQTARVHSFTTNLQGPARLDARGELIVWIGATLDVPAGGAAGHYRSSYTILVEYEN